MAECLQPMVRRARGEMRIPLAEVFCDATYVTGCNLAICDQREIYAVRSLARKTITLVPSQQGQAAHDSQGAVHLVPEENRYRCPQGIRWSGLAERSGKQADGEINVMHRYRCLPEHCRPCPLQSAMHQESRTRTGGEAQRA